MVSITRWIRINWLYKVLEKLRVWIINWILFKQVQDEKNEPGKILD